MVCYAGSTMPAPGLIEKAQRVVNGIRDSSYSGVRAELDRIAKMWGAYMDIRVTWLDVAHLLVMTGDPRWHDEFAIEDDATFIDKDRCAVP